MLYFKVFWLDFNFSFNEISVDIFSHCKFNIHRAFMHMTWEIQVAGIPCKLSGKYVQKILSVLSLVSLGTSEVIRASENICASVPYITMSFVKCSYTDI